MFLGAVDTDALLEMLWVAPAAGLTVAISFAGVIHGATRASDSRRDGRVAGMVAYGSVATLSMLLFVASITLGIVVIAA